MNPSVADTKRYNSLYEATDEMNSRNNKISITIITSLENVKIVLKEILRCEELA